MRIMFLSPFLAAAVSACNSAAASAPDSRNPAHCIASLSHQLFGYEKQGQPKDMIRDRFVRIAFEIEKAKNAGNEQEAKDSSMKFAKANADKPEMLDSLANECAAGQETIRTFRPIAGTSNSSSDRRPVPVRRKPLGTLDAASH